MKFVVLGGYGMMGRVVVRDLVTFSKNAIIVIAGHDPEKVRQVVRQYKSSRVKGAAADASSIPSMARAFRGADVVINCVQYELNLKVMEACLKAKCHYLDLGGLFHMTRKQLKLHQRFKRAGLLVILGCGAAPGITNLLAQYSADQLDRVREVRVRVGGADFTKTKQPFVISYSPQTILEEHTTPPMVFTKGKFRAMAPRSGRARVYFPPPIGVQQVIRTLHSEVATLPLTLKAKGIRECDFKIAFDPKLEAMLDELIRTGLTSRKAITANGKRIAPFTVAVQILSKFQRPHGLCPKDQEILRVMVKGSKRGKSKTLTIDCWAHSNPRWCMGAGDIDTGVPLSIAAQLIAAGVIGARGVLPPERCIPLRLFFHELQKRKMRLFVNGKRVRFSA